MPHYCDCVWYPKFIGALLSSAYELVYTFMLKAVMILAPSIICLS